ncbi:hypothetical protein Efla_002156 [Eimeria flavescens]
MQGESHGLAGNASAEASNFLLQRSRHYRISLSAMTLQASSKDDSWCPAAIERLFPELNERGSSSKRSSDELANPLCCSALADKPFKPEDPSTDTPLELLERLLFDATVRRFPSFYLQLSVLSKCKSCFRAPPVGRSCIKQQTRLLCMQQPSAANNAHSSQQGLAIKRISNAAAVSECVRGEDGGEAARGGEQRLRSETSLFLLNIQANSSSSSGSSSRRRRKRVKGKLEGEPLGPAASPRLVEGFLPHANGAAAEEVADSQFFTVAAEAQQATPNPKASRGSLCAAEGGNGKEKRILATAEGQQMLRTHRAVETPQPPQSSHTIVISPQPTDSPKSSESCEAEVLRLLLSADRPRSSAASPSHTPCIQFQEAAGEAAKRATQQLPRWAPGRKPYSSAASQQLSNLKTLNRRGKRQRTADPFSVCMQQATRSSHAEEEAAREGESELIANFARRSAAWEEILYYACTEPNEICGGREQSREKPVYAYTPAKSNQNSPFTEH